MALDGVSVPDRREIDYRWTGAFLKSAMVDGRRASFAVCKLELCSNDLGFGLFEFRFDTNWVKYLKSFISEK
jgi:hypothetical protein